MSDRIEPNHLIIPQDMVPAAAYQAIYHKLTSKVEKLTETFDDAYEFRVDDFIQLDAMLCQVVRQYPVQSQNSTCSISFHKDERIDSSSLDIFKLMNFTTNKPTESVEYNFDFFTILPVEIPQANDIVQRFKVTVKADQDFIEDGLGIPNFYKRDGVWTKH